jgi:hypothetical protein
LNKTPGILVRSGCVHVCRRLTEPDAEDAMKIRAVDKSCAARDLGHVERSAAGIHQQPPRLNKATFEKVLIERFGCLLEQAMHLAPRDAERKPYPLD